MESGDQIKYWMGDYYALTGDCLLHSGNDDTLNLPPFAFGGELQRWIKDALLVSGNCRECRSEEVVT